MIKGFFRWWWSKRWRRWLTVGGLPLFLAGNVALVEVTSHSNFCKSCHIMVPYYESWANGSHKDVQCVKCHIEPGVDNFIHAKLNGLGQVVDDVLNRTSFKPSARVGELSCTRAGCHTVETISSRKIDNGTFKFDHAKHLDAEVLGIKMACGTCHAHIKGADHFEVNTDACITCHLSTRYANGDPTPSMMRGQSAPILMAVRGQSPPNPHTPAPAPDAVGGEKSPPASCTTCHNAPAEAFERDGLTIDHAQFLSYGASCESCHKEVTARPEPIDDAKCLSCHSFGVERSLPTAEMHRVHAEGHHKVECFSCHGVTRHGTPAQIISMGEIDCRACHKDQHAVQQQTYLTTGLHPHDPTTPLSPMFLSHVSCTGCHISQEQLFIKPDAPATVAKASAKSCDNCHAAGLGERLIPLWQNDTRTLYNEVLALLEQSAPAARRPALLEEARALLALVKADNSWGVHNPRYTLQLLEQARAKVRESLSEAPTPPS
jgi:nitrate/TMAO reductase-like tetraheme cytochrome c subunit